MAPSISNPIAGRYQLGELLGRGALGSAHLATDLRSGAEVVLKFAAGPLRDSEWAALRALDHPALACVLDAPLWDGGGCLVLERAPGRPLRELLPLEPSAALEVLIAVAEGLAYLHGQGIYHLDVKPENIVVDPARRPPARLIDFGLSVLRPLSGARLNPGTPAYAAAGLLRAGDDGARLDLYALGVTGWELCFGLRPDEARSAPPGHSVPGMLVDILRLLLETGAGPRYLESAALVADLRRLRGHESAAFAPALETGAAPAPSGPVLVGREAELSLLERRWQEALGGRGSALALVGEAGLGKSLLLQALQRRAVAAGALVLRGRGCAEALAGLLPRAERIPGPVVLSPAQERERQHLRWVESVLERTEAHGLLLTLDDQESADDDGLPLLRLLLPRLADRRMLLVLAGRPPAQAWLPEELETRIVLPPLARPALLALVRERLPRAEIAVQRRLAEQLERQTGGHPLFAAEMLRRLVERAQGAAEPEAMAESLLELPLPSKLEELLSRRLDELGQGVLGVLEIAALQGRVFDAGRWPTDLAGGPVAIAQALETARRAGVVEALSEGQHAFLHDVFVERLLARLGPRAVELHGRLALALATNPDDRPLELLHHALEAGLLDLALDAARNAMPQALARYALGPALRLGEKLWRVSAAGHAADRRRLALAGWLGEIRELRGDNAGAGEAYEQALAVATDPQDRARWLTKLGGVAFRGGQYLRARGCLEQALEALGEPQPATLGGVLWSLLRHGLPGPWRRARLRGRGPAALKALADLYQQLTYVDFFIDVPRAMAANQRQRLVAQASGDLAARAYAEALAAGMSMGISRPGQARKLGLRALDLARESGDRHVLAGVNAFVGICEYYAGRPAAALPPLLLAREQFGDIGYPFEVEQAEIILGFSLHLLGRLSEAATTLDRNLARAERLGYDQAVADASFGLGSLLADLGQPQRAEQLLCRALSLAEAGRANALLELVTRRALAQVLIGGSRLEEARVEVGRVLELAGRIRVLGDWLVEVELLPAELALASSKTAAPDAAARAHLRRALRLAGRFPNHAPRAWRVAAACQARAGRARRAARSLVRAEALAGRMGQALEEARVWAERSWGPPDLGGCDPQTLRRRAAERFRQLGAVRDLAAVAGAPGGEGEGGAAAALERRPLQAVLDVARELGGEREPAALLSRLLEAAIELVGAERGFLLLRRMGPFAHAKGSAQGLGPVGDLHSWPGGLELVLARGVDEPGQGAGGLACDISASVLREVLGGRPVLVHDAQSDPRFGTAPSVASYRLRSTLCVPLRLGGEVAGALYLDNRLVRALFEERQAGWLMTLAAQAAVALDSALAYQRLASALAELRANQQELVQREKLAALGRMSAGLTHEIRNPLSHVDLSLAYALRTAGEGLSPRAREHLDRAREELRRCDRLLGRLLEHVRPRDEPPAELALAEAVAEALDLAQAQEEVRRCQVERDLDGAVRILGRRDGVIQVVLNLVVNAAQALADRPAGRIAVRVCAWSGRARLSVSDNGPGIPEHMRAQLFLPFATSKAEGHGLGLYVSMLILQQQGGTLGAQAVPGGGAEFRAEWPLLETEERGHGEIEGPDR